MLSTTAKIVGAGPLGCVSLRTVKSIGLALRDLHFPEAFSGRFPFHAVHVTGGAGYAGNSRRAA